MRDKWPVALGALIAVGVVALLAWQAWAVVLPWEYL